METTTHDPDALCGARARRCACIKPVGHAAAGDDVHACNPETCGGSWRGTFDTDDFEVVSFPLLGLLGRL